MEAEELCNNLGGGGKVFWRILKTYDNPRGQDGGRMWVIFFLPNSFLGKHNRAAVLGDIPIRGHH